MSCRRRASRLAPLLLALAALLLAAPTASAVQPRTTLSTMELQLMCVVCRTPLAVANGAQADDERQQIRELIAQGKTEQQIKDAFVAEYGTRVLALPPSGGFDLTVYVVPGVILLLGLTVLAVALPRWRRRARAPAAAAPTVSDEDMRRLDEDLARHD